MRKPIFDALRTALGGSLSADHVKVMDEALDRIGVAREGAARRINPAGLQLIKDSEGLELKAYKDAVGVLPIGYGSTGKHVTPGKVITEAQAETLLLEDLTRFEAKVAQLAPQATDNQFAACVSLAYNVGIEAFRTSTLLRLHNEGRHMEAADQFLRWTKAGGRELAGLVTRRRRERALYLAK